MEKIRVAIGAAALTAACVGCGGDRIDANGIPLERVPAGFQAKECHFEDIPASGSDPHPQRWQRLVCQHGASSFRHSIRGHPTRDGSADRSGRESGSELRPTAERILVEAAR